MDNIIGIIIIALLKVFIYLIWRGQNRRNNEHVPLNN